MGHASDPKFVVLHGLRLKGFADVPAIGATTAIEPPTVDRVLGELAVDELCVKREGRISGWSLTPAGRAEHADLVRVELHEAGCRATVEAAYRRFLDINTELLRVCTDWQIRSDECDQVPNDHSDRAYDAKVIGRLGDIDTAVQPVCTQLAGTLDRFGRYGPRLAAAFARVQAGETEWFTKPMIDSYHTVWFEMHEDLLVTLGIERHKEGET